MPLVSGAMVSMTRPSTEKVIRGSTPASSYDRLARIVIGCPVVETSGEIVKRVRRTPLAAAGCAAGMGVGEGDVATVAASSPLAVRDGGLGLLPAVDTGVTAVCRTSSADVLSGSLGL